MLLTCSRKSLTEEELFKYAIGLTDADDRLEAFEDFLATYPASEKRRDAMLATVDAHIELGHAQEALAGERTILDSLSGNARSRETVRFIGKLVANKLASDSAAAWAGGMIADSTIHPYYVNWARHHRAALYAQAGDIDQALTLQRQVVETSSEETDWLRQVAVFAEAAGEHKSAITSAAQLGLQGDVKSVNLMLEWIDKESPNADERAALKASSVMNVVRPFVDTSTTPWNSCSLAAVFLARTSVATDTARAWSDAAMSSLDIRSPVETYAQFHMNRALMLSALGQTEDALRVFASVEDLIDPYQQDAWSEYASMLDKAGRRRELTRAHALSLLAGMEHERRSAFLKSYRESYGSTDGALIYIETLRDSMAEFTAVPETAGPGTGRVVLVELFTGADCGPCVSSDLALDLLAEAYPRSSAAIVEYHVHVPRPDPLTTDDSYDRYVHYGRNGTPTVVIDGTQPIIGGGPKWMKKNRYSVYRFAVGRASALTPSVDQTAAVSRSGDRVNVAVSLKATSTAAGVLHVALVEKSVNYTGSNGIKRHAFVMRKMAGGSTGTPVRADKKEKTMKYSFDLAAVEKELQAMIDSPDNRPSWPTWMKKKHTWKSLPEKMNYDNLAVVVWLQDPKTNEVLQAGYWEVSAK
jgi:tetratricopeptide (TPR) repeat protein